MSVPIRTGPQRVVDAGCVLVLVALALAGFDETFNGRAYLATGMAAAVVVVALALLVAATRHARTGAFLLAAAAAYIPVGAVAAFRPFSEGRLPSGREYIDVLAATLTGAEELLTTIPPVDPEGSVLVLPYALGFLSAGAAAWLAMRTRRPLLPVVPLLAALAGVIALGPLDSSDRTLIIGTTFASVSLWWGAWRAADPVSRDIVVTHAARGRIGRVLSGVLVVAVAAGLVLTVAPTVPLDEERAVLRGKVGRGATIDDFDNPLVSFRRFTDQDDGSPDNAFNKVLFVVRGAEEPVAIRFATLDTYDGTAWRAGNRTVADAEDDLFQRIGSRVAAPRPGEPLTLNVDLRAAYQGAWLPLAGQLTGIDFDFTDGRAQRDDVRYNPATSSATVVGGLGPGDDYTFTADVPVQRLADNSQAYVTDGPLMDSGAPLDDYLAAYADSTRPPLDQVLLLARYLRRNGRYSDGAGGLVVPAGHDINRLAAGFIGAERILGNDEQYAAFLALAANRLGVPARVVVGTVAGDGRILGKDVSAWVEVRVRDGSWRILPTNAFMSTVRPRADDKPPQPLGDYVDQQSGQDGDQDSEQQAPLPDPSGLGDAPPPDTGGDDGAPWRPATWMLLVGLLSWAVPVTKWGRRQLRRAHRRTSGRVAGAWTEVVDAATDLGIPVPTGVTRERQGESAGVPAALAQHADDLIFGPQPPSAEDAAYYWQAADQARRTLAAAQSRRRRALALFNPSSLLTPLRNPGVR